MTDRPVSGLGELRIADYFHELFRLRNKRNAVVETGDFERAHELNEKMDDLLRDLKRVGVPYHPAFGNRDDWERLDASNPAKHDYEWNRQGVTD
jgi:hypothetical protein